LRLVAVPLSPHTFKTIERPSPTMDSTPSLCQPTQYPGLCLANQCFYATRGCARHGQN
jgi:hypothetical protein